MNIEEKWHDIENFKNVMNGLYEVNNYGYVRNKHTMKILHMKIANKKKHPYRAVSLLHNDGELKWVLVHQLVATYFVKNLMN